MINLTDAGLLVGTYSKVVAVTGMVPNWSPLQRGYLD
jgi:hypothetical protein